MCPQRAPQARASLRQCPSRASARAYASGSSRRSPLPRPPRRRRGRRSPAGEHVLVSAPTGSGKTLAAFLWALDRLSADGASVGRGRRRGHARRLRQPAQGARLRHRAQPARAPARDRRRRRARRHPHRRHAPARARRDGPQPARHPRHHARVAVPDPHLAGARDARRRRGGDRRRDPRRRALQARLAPRAHARAPRGARALVPERPRGAGRRGRRRCGARRASRDPADRPQRHPEPAGGDRPLPRRPAPPGDDRRRRRAKASSTCASRCPSSRWPNPTRPGRDLADGGRFRA